MAFSWRVDGLVFPLGCQSIRIGGMMQRYMFLTEEEIRQLTGHKRSDAQAKELRKMDIEYKTRANGSVAVHRAYLEKEFGLLPEQNITGEPFKINLEGINAA